MSFFVYILQVVQLLATINNIERQPQVYSLATVERLDSINFYFCCSSQACRLRHKLERVSPVNEERKGKKKERVGKGEKNEASYQMREDCDTRQMDCVKRCTNTVNSERFHMFVSP